MSEIISWILVVMAGIFAFFWITTYLLLQLGSFIKPSVKSIEFLRLWLKPLFLINFSWYLIVEIVFSLIYWTKFILLSVLSLFSPMFKFLNMISSSDKPAFFYWVLYSVVIYIIVMIPYFFLQHKLSYYFKRSIFTMLSGSYNAQNARFIGQSGGIAINEQLYTNLAAKDEKIKTWVTQSLEDYQTSAGNENRRFSITMASRDHMCWEKNNINANFFEAEIEFLGEKKHIDSKGKTDYEIDLNKKMFDGIVICIKDAFETSWSPTVFELDKNISNTKTKTRTIHKQKFLIKIFNDIVFKAIATKTNVEYKNSELKQYVVPEIIAINTDSLVQYIVCDESNLFILLRTDLESTSFDLNMNIPVKESIELFKQDLTMVDKVINEVDSIIKQLEEIHLKDRVKAV